MTSTVRGLERRLGRIFPSFEESEGRLYCILGEPIRRRPVLLVSAKLRHAVRRPVSIRP